jgi:hypothetical protein
MSKRDATEGDGKDWQRLCELVATENNPERLSRLIDQLLKELDARRRTLRESEK